MKDVHTFMYGMEKLDSWMSLVSSTWMVRDLEQDKIIISSHNV